MVGSGEYVRALRDLLIDLLCNYYIQAELSMMGYIYIYIYCVIIHISDILNPSRTLTEAEKAHIYVHRKHHKW